MNQIDIAAIRKAAKSQWIAETRKSLSVQERIGQSVPWWLVAVAGVFFLLSAPHTAEVFNTLTPGFGKIAPLGVEAGTLYVAFFRYQVKRRNEYSPWTVNALGVVIIIISVVVNGVGSLSAVVSGVSLQDLPFDAMLARFGTLPAVAQSALLIVPFAAVIIPLGTYVAGEGLARLILEQRETGNWLETEWAKVRTAIEYETLRDSSIASGMSPAKAVRFAAAVLQSEVKHHSADKTDDVDSGQKRTVDKTPKRIKAELYYIEHAGNVGSVRQFAEAVGISKSLAAEIKAELSLIDSVSEPPLQYQ